MIRINKYLAQCGITSRRNADQYVTDGRVTVNGTVVDTPGHKIDESADEVRVDGEIIVPVKEHTYIVLNKPAGYVTSLSDPHHQRTVADLIAGVSERVYPVGRLDLDTEGVLLFSNDGEMAHRLTHPRYGIIRVYQARVKGKMLSSKLPQFSKGIELPDGNVGRAEVQIERATKEHSNLILQLTEGRKREVKHLCKAVGHPVIKLVRIEFAGIDCARIKPGQWRHLTGREISDLRKLVGL
jgi:pseudouridine synthase